MGIRKAIIIGAGPAGLTAAYELLDRTDIVPVVLESDAQIGGISKTVNYRGNRIDIGGHRFFSKSDRVMDWWLGILPQEGTGTHGKIDPEKTDKVMLVRKRLSRIYYLRKLFDYPVSANLNTLMNLGPALLARIFFSYVYIRLFPVKNERSLEDFLVNRFGRKLYNTFFKNYTEKVWGVACNKIGAEWGMQRIKGLSVSKAIYHAIQKAFSNNTSIRQKETETSLIEQFLYPKFGPGQLWETVAGIIEKKGGKIIMGHRVVRVMNENGSITGVVAKNGASGEMVTFHGDYFFSSMPVKDLISSFVNPAGERVKDVANGLIYRDFITVGLLMRKLKIHIDGNPIQDNWIYIQESDVKIGRLQIFNNWSPYMVKDRDKMWIGIEYFCNEGDELWNMGDDAFVKFAVDELAAIDIVEPSEVLDSVVIRVPKAYPAYFGSYNQFDVIRKYTDTFKNLFLIGRNGMHRYNNQDHSMITAMTAVANIINGIETKENIWSVNTEEAYHEKRGRP